MIRWSLFFNLLLALSLIAFAATHSSSAPATQPAASNTKCPVSGDAIDAKAKTTTHEGKTIGFCCDDCVEPFNKNPEKYGKNIR